MTQVPAVLGVVKGKPVLRHINAVKAMQERNEQGHVLLGMWELSKQGMQFLPMEERRAYKRINILCRNQRKRARKKHQENDECHSFHVHLPACNEYFNVYLHTCKAILEVACIPTLAYYSQSM